MKIQKTSKNLTETIKKSIILAKKYNSEIIDENMLFVALLSVDDSAAVRTLQDLNIDIDTTIEKVLSSLYGSSDTKNLIEDWEENNNIKDIQDLDVSESYKNILENAYKVAMNMMAPYVGTEHLLISWYENTDSEIKNNLVKKGIDHQALYAAIKNTVKYPVLVEDKGMGDKNSIIKLLGKNLTEMAKKGQLDPVVGRGKEMERMTSILLRRTKNNPILLGDAGVGKTAIVEGFAQRIVDGNVPYIFRDKSIWQIDSTLLFAGSQMRGDIESKLLGLIDEVSNDPSIILFIDEIHTIMGAAQAAGGGTDIANILKPALAKGQLRCIGATTYAEYVKYIESDPALARRFQPVFIEEIDSESAKTIINSVKPTLENYHNVSITEDIVDEAVQLSERYISDRFLPDKALDLLDEASAKVNMRYSDEIKDNVKILSDLEQEEERLVIENDISNAAKIRQAKRDIEKTVKNPNLKNRKSNHVKSTDLKEVVSQWTGIPVTSLTTADIKKIKNLSNLLSDVIIGQNKAVNIVSDALQVAKVGIADEKKPMASFLFAGPTGVGKTELAKQIAATLFGSKENMVQLDMSEFMESHAVSKLIGSPPGYIGFDMGGQLTEKIRKRPYSVVLFDEIEKAHPDVLNVLLQILEEGRLTDSKGRVANFKNTVIIMTTNLGAKEISGDDVLGLRVNNPNDSKREERAYEDMQKMVLNELKKVLLPEFINRIDHIVIFKSLTTADIDKIAELNLIHLSERIKKFKKVNVEFTKNIVKRISELGFDEEYGARNINRKINEIVESAIGRYLISQRKSVKQMKVDYRNSEVQISQEE